MESCRNLESEAPGVMATGIMRSAAQQPGFLFIAIDTFHSTHPLQTATAFQSTTHLESRNTLPHSSCYLLGHFATKAMPPKRSKRAMLGVPGPKVKRNKLDRGSLPNYYTVDNWKGFLPNKILEAVLAVKVSRSKTRKMRTIVSTG